MLAAARIVVTLLKLRIGVAIAASALAGLAAASGEPVSAGRIAALTLAVLGAAGAAAAFNHYYERDSDRLMTRTSGRPFASGQLKPGPAWPVTFSALLGASILLAWASAGTVAALYVFLGAITYGLVYTVWLKRRTAWNIVIGGLAGSFAVLAGAAAIDPQPQWVPGILAVVLFLWTPPHFWSLAAAKADDYAAAGVPMLPVVASEREWTLAILSYTAALAALSLAPIFFGMGWIYGVFAAGGGGWFLWKSWQLHHAPSRKAAMANFLASRVQLLLLVVGIFLSALVG
ncbi:protoheme IX farnesyltransferase [Pseudaminobacter arsenicus]|uniref:Protoheme IX farnesyltransferase n=1 Tax=Borborobacter arsenicus TaxID=1851146 RepID=A0A432UZ23_9HYPH|nr:heme o synthase [Pseudaminobacter arsenicus]RUM95187.1 protoheme IX farnesyltransferase [Pseudaminobacter arsenicus]